MINKKQIKVQLGDQDIPLQIVDDVNDLLEGVENEDQIPFWAELWPSAIALGRLLFTDAKLKGVKVLELGAGIGLPGICAALKGAWVTQTDFVPEALDIARENALLNGVKTKLAREDWRKFGLRDKFDVILGSDILYEPKMHSYIKKIIDNNLKEGGRVILSDPGREAARGFIRQFTSDRWFVDDCKFEIYQRNITYHISIYCLTTDNSRNK